MITSVVVVGGGIAGISTLAALRANGFDGDLTLVDAGEFPYDRPPLSKDYLAGATEIKDIALQRPQWYDDHKVRLIAGSTVAALRTDIGAVELGDGTTVRADRVVLATGGRPARPPIPGAGSPRVHGLRTAEDADKLRAALAPGARLLIVGAGLIGAEVASTASALGCEVTIADPMSPPLSAALGPDVAAWLHGMHAEHGVTALRSVVDAFEDIVDGVAVTFAGDEQPRVFDAALLAVGMTAETTLAEAAGLRVSRGVLVDHGHVTSNPAVLAVGDAATTYSNGVPLHRSEHWEAAQHDGQRAAATILGAARPAETAPWFWTDRYGVNVQVVGALDDAERLTRRGALDRPPFSIFGLRAGRVVGAVAVDDPMVVRVARRMIDRAVAVDPAELSDSSTDLRKLLRQ